MKYPNIKTRNKIHQNEINLQYVSQCWNTMQLLEISFKRTSFRIPNWNQQRLEKVFNIKA
jgi:hypothetical protein